MRIWILFKPKGKKKYIENGGCAIHFDTLKKYTNVYVLFNDGKNVAELDKSENMIRGNI